MSQAKSETGTDQAPQVDHRQLVALNKLFYQGYIVSRALHVAAVLGIADVLRDGPLTSEEIASKVNANTAALYRLLRALARVGVFTEQETNRFSLTPLGMGLRSDLPGSLRAYVSLYGAPVVSQPANELLYSIQTGLPAFQRVFGIPLFEFLKQTPEVAREFDAGMASISGLDIADILAVYDFAGVKTLADIGGGNGGFLASILKTQPGMSGILLDRASAIQAAQSHLTDGGLIDRCELVSGDFFDKIPSGADAYVLKSVLHDWDDTRSIKILQNCRLAMTVKAKLLVIEPVILPDAEDILGNFVDLTMLVMTEGGRERTVEEFRALFDVSGFQLTNVIHTGSRVAIVEAAPV